MPARRGAGEGVDTGDDRGGGAGAAEDRPAGAAVGVVDRDAGGRVGDRGDVGDGALGAAGVLLPGRLGVVGGAAGAGALGPLVSRPTRDQPRALDAVVSEVPPTAVTYCEAAGYSAP